MIFKQIENEKEYEKIALAVSAKAKKDAAKIALAVSAKAKKDAAAAAVSEYLKYGVLYWQ